MKSCIPLLIVALLSLFTGCTDHYYRVKQDTVHIYIKKPDAKVMYFASSLDGYRLHKAKQIDNHTWEVTAPAYVEFKYFCIADEVLYVPSCRFKECDDFGAENCVYIPEM
ncbi:MAG: hypothetical protein JSV50_18120 [Desulfobacteraceae bacterium]|nr:MAG: hypothetical protein JSV50_18120 [Desulfobacteraceae bacterium]